MAEAAAALGVEEGMIAKTMSFLQGEQPVLILTEGTAKVDNRKYKWCGIKKVDILFSRIS